MTTDAQILHVFLLVTPVHILLITSGWFQNGPKIMTKMIDTSFHPIGAFSVVQNGFTKCLQIYIFWKTPGQTLSKTYADVSFSVALSCPLKMG